MSAESLVGSLYGQLSTGAQDLVDSVLGDTVNGDVTVGQVGSGTLVVGTGANGELQGVLVSSGQAITGELKAGELELSVALPAGVALAFEGPATAVTAETAREYLQSVVESALPAESADPGVVALRESILAGIEALTQALVASGGGSVSSVSVKVVTLTRDPSALPASSALEPNAGGMVSFTGDSNSTELLAFVMSQLGSGDTLLLKNVKSGLIVGSGKVALDQGSGAVALSGDASNQSMAGADGADTLVGGGGIDTLTGGGGADLFGVNSISGQLIIQDFDVTKDKIGFLFDGITSWDQVAPFLTSVTESGGNSTISFSTGASITLVGVSAKDLTIDLAKFSV